MASEQLQPESHVFKSNACEQQRRESTLGEVLKRLVSCPGEKNMFPSLDWEKPRLSLSWHFLLGLWRL